MKRTIFIVLISILAMFSSCKKDDNNPSPDNLAGTTWISDDEESSVEFISKTQFQFNWIDTFRGGKYPQEEDGIYSIDKNKIIFDFGDGDPMNGIIDGNSISFVWIGEVIIVKKQ